MKIVLATSNKHKVLEIKNILKDYKIYSLDEIIKPFEIIEDGNTFKENALIKSKSVFNKIDNNEFIVLSDDSGISVKALNNEPGIYSARYSKQANDKSNREKLISNLRSLNLTNSLAFYTCAIAISSKFGHFCVHGYMYGKVIDKELGENGFGYDSLFVPNNYDLTLAQMSNEDKDKISHRFKALQNAKYILRSLDKAINQSR